MAMCLMRAVRAVHKSQTISYLLFYISCFLSKNLSVAVKFTGALESSSKLSIYEYGLRTAYDGRYACLPIARQ